MSAIKQLCVMSDDFGMHPAVNEGIVKAFVDGVMTDTNLMAPCPAFEEAVALTRAHSIPVGLHTTVTCDWDVYRWGPLTDAPSLVTSGGFLKDSVADAWDGVDETEALNELRAQHEAIASQGISMTHIGEHMGVDHAGKGRRVMTALAREKGVCLKGHWRQYEPDMPHHIFDSSFSTSAVSTDLNESKAWLKEKLFGLGPGCHLWVIHAAMDHPSLDELCSHDFHAVNWARVYRANDLALTLDSEVKEWIEQLRIELVPTSDCPKDWAGVNPVQ